MYMYMCENYYLSKKTFCPVLIKLYKRKSGYTKFHSFEMIKNFLKSRGLKDNKDW